MMKKVWPVLLAVVLVFGFAVLGCGGGDEPPPEGGNNFTSDLSGLSTQLIKNEYAEDSGDSRGLQAKFDNRALMQGHKVLKDDEITLQIKFKLDKTLDYDLEIGFVDTTVGATEGYWRTLTWDKNDSDDGMYRIDKDKLVADTEIEEEIVLTALQDASSAAAAANTLVFESRDVWTKQPVTITFVSFLVIFGDGGNEPPPPPPPPPENLVFDVTVDGETVEAEALPYGGEVEIVEGGFIYTAETPNYQGTYVCFSVDLGDLTLLDIESVSFKAEGLKGDFGNKTGTNGLQLWASKTKITGGRYSDAPQVQTATAGYTGTSGVKDLSIEIDPVKVLALGLSEESVVYFVIYWPMGGSGGEGSYQITDIEFVKSDTPFVPIQISTTITGIQAPAAGGTPTATVTGTGYTGAVTWGGALTDGKFVLGTVYTATIVLTKTTGYTFEGITADSFVVGDATVTNLAGTSGDTLTVTAVFPAATGPIPDKVVTFTPGDLTEATTEELAAAGFIVRNSKITEVTENGFTIDQIGGYGPYAAFKVKFETGVTLSKYTKITFTYTGVSGDSKGKQARVFIYDTPLDTNLLDSGDNKIGQSATYSSNDNFTSKTDTISFASVIPAIDLNEVWVIINLWSGAAVFTVSDIRFHNDSDD